MRSLPVVPLAVWAGPLLCLALAMPAPCQAQPIGPAEVLPASIDYGTYGNDWLPIPFGQSQSSRLQIAYDRTAAGFDTPVQVRAIRFRPYRTGVSGYSSAILTIAVEASTTPKPPDMLSKTFEDNHGPDRKTVFPQGSFTVPSTPGLLNEPGFSIEVPLRDPITWNPRAGALLLDIRSWGIVAGGSQRPRTEVVGGGSEIGMVASLGDVNAPRADFPISPNSAPFALPIELVLEEQAVPAGLDDVEGTSSTFIPWGTATGSSSRLMQIYEPSVLSIDRTTQITHLSWRTNSGAAFRAGRSFDMKVSLSTGRANAAAAISNVFNRNHGIDRKVVFDGVWTPLQSAAGQSPGPFAQILQLDTPFDFVPANGSLVVDIQIRNVLGSSSVPFDAAPAPGVARIYDLTDDEATTATITGALAMVMSVAGVPSPVAPEVADGADGNTATVIPWGSTQTRVQYGYDRLAVGRNLPLDITHLAWRPDVSVTEIGPIRYRVRAVLSTGPMLSSTLMSTRFAANHGNDATVVFDGELSIPYQRFSGSNERPWALELALDRPFHWIPRLGPLIVDLQALRLQGTSVLFDGSNNSSVLGVNRVWHGSNRFAPDATSRREPLGIAVRLGGYGAHGEVIPSGMGCGSAGRTPIASTNGVPFSGDGDFTLTLFDAPGFQPAFAELGAGTPMPVNLAFLGAPECNVYVQGRFVSLSAVTDLFGNASIPFPLPLDPALEDFQLGLQWAVVSPSSRGFALSNHLRLRVGH